MNMIEEKILNRMIKIKYIFEFPFARDTCLKLRHNIEMVLFKPIKFEMVMFKSDL